MHRPASSGRLFGLVFALAMAGLLFSSRAATTDSLVPVTSLAALNPDDSLSWSQLGPDSTSLESTFDANSMGSTAVTGTLAAAGSLASVVCPASQCSWGSPGNGGFSAADTVIWTSDTANGGNGPLTLAFGSPVHGVGALIQADGPATFTAQIQVFNGATMLGSFATSSDAAGDAVFLGALDQTAANITSVVYSLTACTGACTDFAIDTLYINTTGQAGATPTPTTSMTGSPAKINFGNVDATGLSTAHKVTITNKGAFSAMVGSVGIPATFKIVTGTDGCSGHSVAAKKNCTMMLQFAPATFVGSSGTVLVPYNGGAAMIAVSGTGDIIKMIGPQSASFGTVAAGLTSAPPKILTVTNMSKTATAVMDGAPIITGPFTVASDTCAGKSIGPKAKCQVGLQFAPPAETASKTTLTGTMGFGFTYGANSGLMATVKLSGKVK